MSQAFVKESDENGLLHHVTPTIPALVNYIKAENNGNPVFVKKINNEDGRELIYMSNGFIYFINPDNQWEMYL
ncbi:MAG TPA: hypothetical protein PLY34_04670 [Ferruginibacter sp.]|jgi:hypothetical protein|nr:hypothetical protein [Ferruginibacter sp.]HPH90499.1 hypothetical protein [Ferruginibacter sp.]